VWEIALLSRDVLPLIDEAATRVYSVVTETPLVPMASGTFERATAFAKLEQLQITGSFKLRGATNKLMSLTKAQAAAGVITSSTGNHGLGVAAAAKKLGITDFKGIRISLASAGVWCMVFTIPVLLALRNRAPARVPPPGKNPVAIAFRQLAHTLKDARRFPQTLLFLAAYMIYNDAIQTVLAVAGQFGTDALKIPISQLATAILMAHARGVILLVAARRGVRVEQFPANRIKQSVTGHGHASKEQMQRAIQSLWNLKDPPDPPDVADALAVALCCGRHIEMMKLRSDATVTIPEDADDHAE